MKLNFRNKNLIRKIIKYNTKLSFRDRIKGIFYGIIILNINEKSQDDIEKSVVDGCDKVFKLNVGFKNLNSIKHNLVIEGFKELDKK